MRTYTELRQLSAFEIKENMGQALYDGLALTKSEWADLGNNHVSRLATWAVCTFAAQDFSYAIPKDKAPDDPLLVGADYPDAPTHHFEHGILGKRVKSLYERACNGDELAQKRFDRLSSRTAEFIFILNDSMPHWNDHFRDAATLPHTIITMDQDTSSAHFIIDSGRALTHPLEGPQERIASLGPGLSGNVLHMLLGGIAKNFYQIHGGMGGVFCSDWNRLNEEGLRYRLESTAESDLPGPLPEEFTMLPQSHHSSAGIAKGLGVLRDKEVSLDTVIMSSVHSAGIAECTSGIEQSAQLLRPGGYLLMLSIDTSVGPLAGLDKLTPVARDLFGEPKLDKPCGSNKYLSDPQRFGSLPASALVFQKS
ncbi:MAG TPA: hypothetical protein VFI74_01395 [Candidatus Saccharimonadales bacterium]|nr:hypothetical protein [Candidatus Saccharimonadales bacterium]